MPTTTRTTRQNGAIAAAAILALTLSACGGGSSDDAGAKEKESSAQVSFPVSDNVADGGDMTIAVGALPPALDPALYNTPPNSFVQDLLFSSLTTMSTSDEGVVSIEPGIAKSWERVDDTTWEFTLIEGVEFPDGEPVNAEQMAWSIDWIRDPDNAKAAASSFSTVDTVKADGPNTLVVTTKAPDPLLPNRMVAATALPPKALTKQGEAFFSDPIGTGPFAVTDFRGETSLDLKPNPASAYSDAVLDSLSFIAIPEAGARVSALRAGDVDAVHRLPTDQLETVKKAGLTVASQTETGTYSLTVMADDGPLADPKVRHAISYAIDREGLDEALLAGMGAPASQMANPSVNGYCTSLDELTYDPDKARSLLKEAGYNGEKLVLQASNGYLTNDSVLAEAITEMLSEVGLNVTLQITEYGAYLDAYFDPATRKDIYAWRQFNRAYLDAEFALSSFINATATHKTGWANSEFDDALVAARSALDEEERNDLLCHAAEIFREEMPIVPVLHLPDVWGLSPDVVNFPIQANGIPTFASVGFSK